MKNIEEITKNMIKQAQPTQTQEPPPAPQPPAPQPPDQQTPPTTPQQQNQQPTNSQTQKPPADQAPPPKESQEQAQLPDEIPVEVKEFLAGKTQSTVTNFMRAVEKEVERRLKQLQEKPSTQSEDIEKLRKELEEKTQLINTIKAEASDEYQQMIALREQSRKQLFHIAATLNISAEDAMLLIETDPVKRAQTKLALKKKYGEDVFEVFNEAGGDQIKTILDVQKQMTEFIERYQKNSEQMLKELDAKKQIQTAQQMAEARRRIEMLAEYAAETIAVKIANPELPVGEKTPPAKLREQTMAVLQSIASATNEDERAANIVQIASELAALRERDVKYQIFVKHAMEQLEKHGVGFPAPNTTSTPEPPNKSAPDTAINSEFQKIFQKMKKNA